MGAHSGLPESQKPANQTTAQHLETFIKCSLAIRALLKMMGEFYLHDSTKGYSYRTNGDNQEIRPKKGLYRLVAGYLRVMVKT